MVVDCSDADKDKVVAQDSHSNKTYWLTNINKICRFCKLKIKRKRYCKAMFDKYIYIYIYIYIFLATTTVEFSKWN